MRKIKETLEESAYVVNNAIRTAMCPKLYEEMYFTQILNLHEYFRIERAIGRELRNEIT